MTFKATKLCPPLPNHLRIHPPPKALKEMDDDTIDTFLQAMLDTGMTRHDIPETKYGRREAVKSFLAYNNIRPIVWLHDPWTPQNPTQPR